MCKSSLRMSIAPAGVLGVDAPNLKKKYQLSMSGCTKLEEEVSIVCIYVEFRKKSSREISLLNWDRVASSFRSKLWHCI